MAKKNINDLKKNFEPSEISSKDDSEDIRKYFIDKAIETIEYMSNKVYKGRIRDVQYEKIKIDQLKLVINACNVGNRILKDYQYDNLQREVSELKNAILYDSEGNEIIEIPPEKFNAIDDLDSKIAKLEEDEWSE